MTFLRDPLLLTLLASALAHGTALHWTDSGGVVPQAAVRTGRTSVRLRPSLATVTPRRPAHLPSQTISTAAPHNDERIAGPAPSHRDDNPQHLPPAPDLPPTLTVGPVRATTQVLQRLPHVPAVALPANRIALARNPRPLPPVTANSPAGIAPRISESRHLATTPLPSQPRLQQRRSPIPPLEAVSQPTSPEQDGRQPILPRAHPGNSLPEYPVAAVRERREGVVFLWLQLDARGRVVGTRVYRSSGHRDLDRSATRTARSWRFQPARRNGQPTAIRVIKPFRFRLDRR